MGKETPDIFQILESFLIESFSSKYDEKELAELVEAAKVLVREKMEKEIGREPEPGPMPRRPVFVREPDIEEKLLQSLKESIQKEEDRE